MIERLPEGKSIGWMQAPLQWIFTHTVRFVGVVRVVIQDGEGFILIQKGKPLAYYFKHGRIELRGHAALDYFNSHPTIEFNLCKYTPEEMAEALKICNVDDQGTALPLQPEKMIVAPAVQETAPIVPPVQVPPVVEFRQGPAGTSEPRAPMPVTPSPPPVTVQVPTRPPEPVTPEPVRERPVRNIPPAPPAVTTSPVMPSPSVVLDEATIKIIGQIKKLNGVVAISVFTDDRNILLMGDVEIEPLLKIARSMLATTRRITPLLEWGSFVHMTLQIPEGNIIVAPYHEYYLCLLTTRTINIGHIRRILRDIQIGSE